MSATASLTELAPAPLPPPGFANAADRARLTTAALIAARAIARAWKLTNPEAAALYGMSDSTWERAKRGTRAEPDHGPIGWQSEGSPIRFREMKIRP